MPGYGCSRNAKRYDYVIVRHMEFDPFALFFAWFVPNRVLVHHSKEVLELRQIRKGWTGRAAALLENVSGKVATRTATALVGVTHEVGAYQKDFRGLSEGFPVGFFPNGVNVDSVPLLGDDRPNEVIEVGFMCGTFAAWARVGPSAGQRFGLLRLKPRRGAHQIAPDWAAQRRAAGPMLLESMQLQLHKLYSPTVALGRTST